MPWQVDYPIENFPGFWNRMDELINAGRLVAPEEVLREMTRRSDELHAWLNARKQMFRELVDAVQIEASADWRNIRALSASGSYGPRPIRS